MPWDDYLRYVIALVFVFGLIGLFAALARRMGFGHGLKGSKKGGRRLSLVEILVVDARRRLVLVRRDRVEHLVLLGGPAGADLLIEANIPLVEEIETAVPADRQQAGGAS